MELIHGKDFHLAMVPQLTKKDYEDIGSWLRTYETRMNKEVTIEMLDQVFELGLAFTSILANQHKREAELPRVDWFDLGIEDDKENITQ